MEAAAVSIPLAPAGNMSLDDVLLRCGFDQRRVGAVKVSNIINAFSNGRLFAECICFHAPKLVSVPQIVDESARTKKVENWMHLKPAFAKLGMPLKDSQIEKIIDRELTKEDVVSFLNQIYEQIQLYTATKAMAAVSVKENSPLKKKKGPTKSVMELDEVAKRNYMDKKFEEIAEKSRREYKAIVQEGDRMEGKSTMLDSQLNQFRNENLEELKKSEKRLSKLKFELEIAMGDPRNNFLQNIDLAPFMKITREDQKILRELQSSPNKGGIPPPPPLPAAKIDLLGKPKTVFSINKYMNGI